MDNRETSRAGVFADSYCSWQKRAIENGNKLVRQYIEETDICAVTDGKIAKIRRKINAKPREKFNFVIIVSKNLQKSSAIQNNSITLSSVSMAIIVCNSLFFSTNEIQ